MDKRGNVEIEHILLLEIKGMRSIEIVTSMIIILLASIIIIISLLFEPVRVISVDTISWRDLDIISPDGVKIKAFYITPPDTRGSIILLHGLMEESLMWNNSGIVERLYDSGFSIFMMDLRGHGYSKYYTNGSRMSIDKLKPSDYELMPVDAESLLIIARKITGNKPLFIIGSDIGGNIALRLASLKNKTIDGIILVSPILSDNIPFNYQAFKKYNGLKCIIYGKYDGYSLKAVNLINIEAIGKNVSIHSFDNIEHGILLINVNKEALKYILSTLNKWYDIIRESGGNRPSS